MENQRPVNRSTDNLIVAAVVIVVALVVSVALFWPMFQRTDAGSARKESCLNHLKDLSVALQMYWNDYDGVFPSSVLRRPPGAKGWDPRASAEFCGGLGKFPPPAGTASGDVHWADVLWPHMKDRNEIWCPSDSGLVYKGGSVVSRPRLPSYFYKPAIDRAWFGSALPVDPARPGTNLVMKCFRNESDFMWPADQVVLFERKSWHSRWEKKWWRAGVPLNAAYLDGHVSIIRLRDAVECRAPETPGELSGVMTLGGEPLWFNHDDAMKAHGRGVWYDPRVCFDDLR